MTSSLLLVGRTGNGKSSTGNSILGRREFKPRGASAPLSYEILAASSTINGADVTVVDGPGIGDSKFDDSEGVRSTLEMVEEALSLCPNGFSAMLIVLQYGVRFTKQESDVFKMIKSFFGQNVVKNYGVIVMTHGDSFDLDMEDDPMTFELWCQQQTGEIRDLFRECDNRCVLFNNKTKDEEAREAQYKTLMSMVARIQSKIGPYTDQDFQKAENDRRQILVGSKVPNLREKNKHFLDHLYSRLEDLENPGYQTSADDKLHKLKDLSNQLNAQKQFLQSEAQGTDILKPLLQDLEVAEMRVNTKMNIERQGPSSQPTAGIVHQPTARPGYQPFEDNTRNRTCCEALQQWCYRYGLRVLSCCNCNN